MYRTEFWTLWEKARVGCFKRTALKHVYYLGWNRPSAQAGCKRQVLGPGALARPRGIRWRGRWEGGSGWGIHVNPWLIHVNVWQKSLHYCKVISLQLIKINEKKFLISFHSSSLTHRSTWIEYICRFGGLAKSPTNIYLYLEPPLYLSMSAPQVWGVFLMVLLRCSLHTSLHLPFSIKKKDCLTFRILMTCEII